MNYKQISLPTD
ncbi:hypothetical protein LINPERPRIM_LOCUS627 [Linum perenne]